VNNVKKVIAGVGILLVLAAVARMVPDFVRYVKIRSM
jgi:hypothetical protein